MKHLALILFLLIIPTIGKACSCLNLSPTEQIENAATIYAARATKAELVRFSSLTVKTTFEVLETFKGDTKKTETIVSGGGCRMEYIVGRDYLVLTDKNDDLSTLFGTLNYTTFCIAS
ncbi:MAG: hypothetical protein COA86_00005 [Kangiella sp.]|nr:MAG: hypothetical protein COA86_00005 [Kangiella sp.]